MGKLKSNPKCRHELLKLGGSCRTGWDSTFPFVPLGVHVRRNPAEAKYQAQGIIKCFSLNRPSRSVKVCCCLCVSAYAAQGSAGTMSRANCPKTAQRQTRRPCVGSIQRKEGCEKKGRESRKRGLVQVPANRCPPTCKQNSVQALQESDLQVAQSPESSLG